jgi:hypothetical protein
MAYIQTNPQQLFPTYNEPQLTAIRASLTRRMTMIQGPPGVSLFKSSIYLRSNMLTYLHQLLIQTGKTTTAGSIAFGFVHQCRNISPHCKVLATAFSNVGADNLAEKFLSLGLKVVRVGKPSGVSESLWPYTLGKLKRSSGLGLCEFGLNNILDCSDAAIQKDEFAQKALEEAAKASAKARKSADDDKRKNKGTLSAERAKRDLATDAVKASIQVSALISRA